MSAIAHDDYLAFCEGLREICGIDLSQYRRPRWSAACAASSPARAARC